MSADDAQLSLSDAPNRFLKNLRAKVELVSEREVPGLKIPGADSHWCFKQVTRSKDGEGTAKYAAGTVRATFFAVGCSAMTDLCTWPEVMDVAQVQVRRLTSS